MYVWTAPLTDYMDYYNLLIKNVEYLDFPWVKTATKDMIERYVKKGNMFKIIYDHQFVGTIEFKAVHDGIELGYWLDHDFRNMGIMTRLLTQLKRNSVPYLVTVEHGNLANRHVCEKVGFIEHRSDDKFITYISHK